MRRTGGAAAPSSAVRRRFTPVPQQEPAVCAMQTAGSCRFRSGFPGIRSRSCPGVPRPAGGRPERRNTPPDSNSRPHSAQSIRDLPFSPYDPDPAICPRPENVNAEEVRRYSGKKSAAPKAALRKKPPAVWRQAVCSVQRDSLTAMTFSSSSTEPLMPNFSEFRQRS